MKTPKKSVANKSTKSGEKKSVLKPVDRKGTKRFTNADDDEDFDPSLDDLDGFNDFQDVDDEDDDF